MKIKKALILQHRSQIDIVVLTTDLPSPAVGVTYDGFLRLLFYAPKDTGAEYVRTSFGLEPEIKR